MKEYSDSQKNEIRNRVLAWAEEFEKDQRYKSLTEAQKEESWFIIELFADLMYGYFLQEPSEWTATALEECCLDLLPRKVSADVDFYRNVEPVLTGFFGFLQSRDYISDASRLISRLKKVSNEMIERADNLAYWGPAKQLVMGAMKAGVNLEDAKEFNRYVQMLNLLRSRQNTPPDAKVKVGGNDPCPCGSGQRYKKCCGGGRIVPFPTAGCAATEGRHSTNAVNTNTENIVYQLKITLKGIKPTIWRHSTSCTRSFRLPLAGRTTTCLTMTSGM
ncbi:SEC-C metal-binding domain-containing protein [Desulforudis sp. DRI-14]